MSPERLHSIASIAKTLDLPESTLHYWKNRFDQYLPSVGSGRHRRFRPDALAVFRAVAELLGNGLSVADAKGELARRFPRNVTPLEPDAAPDAERDAVTGVPGRSVATLVQGFGGSAPQGFSAPAAEDAAARVGVAMAEALARHLGALRAPGSAAPGPGAGADLGPELARLSARVEALETENRTIAAKLGVLEAELVRLRKEGREMEKFLLSKIGGKA
uniref:MerR family transcriptional regulator n=1 Tax=Fundidesulfovibrio putealis TaxID=270496 RepID=A0A7C4AB16_9BACT